MTAASNYISKGQTEGNQFIRRCCSHVGPRLPRLNCSTNMNIVQNFLLIWFGREISFFRDNISSICSGFTEIEIYIKAITLYHSCPLLTSRWRFSFSKKQVTIHMSWSLDLDYDYWLVNVMRSDQQWSGPPETDNITNICPFILN